MKTVFIVLLLCACASFSSFSQDSREEVKNIVHDFLNSWQRNDVETFSSLLHEDVVFAYPGDRLNKKALIEMFKTYQTGKNDIKIYLWDEFLMAGDRFATAYQFAATDRATGKRQAVGTGVTGIIENGKILLFKEYYDEEVAPRQYDEELPLDEGIVTPWPASIWLRPETID